MKNYFIKTVLCFMFFSFFCVFCLAQVKEEKSELEKQKEILKYGLESDIVSLITSISNEKDALLSDEVFTLFFSTGNAVVREKILYYFLQIKDDRLKEYCLEFLEDPYDQKNSAVQSVLKYVSEFEVKEASPLVLEILKSEKEELFVPALNACEKLGGKEEAAFLIEYMKNDDISLPVQQALMKVLGQLCVVETYDDLLEIAQDNEKNTYVRSYALEAASKMGNDSVVPVLVDIFSNSDPVLRCYAVKGAANFAETNKDCQIIILDALKDNHKNVRFEAVKVCKEKKFEKAIDSLIFRAKNDPQNEIKYECYSAIGSINIPKSAEFLSSIILEKKYGETARAKASNVIFEYKIKDSYNDVKKVVIASLNDEKEKNLRYAIGKSISKYELQDYEEVCRMFLEHKDASTQGIGLDIFAKNKYANLFKLVEDISKSEDKKNNANAKKAALTLEKISSAK
ncbi:MAG: HEAT repeat domain-containing protein [Treponemataceae bacterium]